MHTVLTMIVALAAGFLPVREIDTRIGSTAADSPTASIFGAGGEVYGNTIPCVTVPNGMTYWTPQTSISDQKGVTPYRYDAPHWWGFRGSHWLDGSATQDYGSFFIVPGCEPVAFDHALETAQPGYYRYAGHELTGAGRSAIMRLDCNRLRFGANTQYNDATLVYDREKNEIRAENPVHRIYNGWGKLAGYSSWAVVRFNKKIKSVSPIGRIMFDIEFEDAPGPLLVSIGNSFTSIEGAAHNLETEIPDWDFEAARSRVEAVWEAKLSQIEVEGGEPDILRHFYTSLWRASLSPRMVSDCDAEPDFDDFNLWDTFRALHPLHTILQPKRSGEMMQALVRKYERGGWMPIFPMWGSYTSAMIGDHAASVIADAYTKGIRNFDCRKAWEGIRKNCFETPCDSLYEDGRGRRALEPYMRLGYLPLEEHVRFAFHANEQTSRTLEYAYDDWCASLLARELGTKTDYKALAARAGNWRNVFDPRTKYVQGRHEDGSFLNDENYLKKTSFITEGTPCHYSWFVPQDIPGLIKFMGRDLFEERLDLMFSEKRYWHGNEPGNQIAYLYDYIGKPEKCQAAVEEIMCTEYRNTPGGLSGNDDAGQLSAWYVFACLGFYPVCPGSAEYALGIPAFDRITIHLENGRDFTIIRKEAKKTGFRVGCRPLRKPFIAHRDIVRGKRLTFFKAPLS
ncbi:MAG: GH92 family glycosyl hydrolase [Bacteroidales bacterium]|nr:GH92 family glycosyl hydrolase [Bacteroidales bacterium]